MASASTDSRRKCNATIPKSAWSAGTFGDGKLATARTVADPVFGIGVVGECPVVPGEVLIPRDAWADKAAYDATAKKLAALFVTNFKQYESGVGAEVRAASPSA